MRPARRVSRRSFLARVGGAVVGSGALIAIPRRAGAQVSDRDSGPGADPAGRGRAALREPGDSDFASPTPIGDTFQSDPPPGRRSAVTDRDVGPAADLPGYGAGRKRREAQAERCSGLRHRIARLEALRPRTAEIEGRIALLRSQLDRWRCP